MNKQDWKSKRESSIDIRKVIDDYEAKLCELHTRNMNLQYDKDRLEKQIIANETHLKIAQKEIKEKTEWWLKADKRAKVYKKYLEIVVSLVRAKWYNRFSMAKILKIDIYREIRY